MNLQDAYTDFILSREAMNVTERTLAFYKFTLSRIISFLRIQDVQIVVCLRTYHFRVILKQLRDDGVNRKFWFTAPEFFVGWERHSFCFFCYDKY